MVLGACSKPEVRGTLPMISGDGFFDRPFPSASRMVDGHPDYEGFPHAGEFPILDAYLEASVEVDGAGTNAPVYVRFEDTLDTRLLPTSEQSIDLGASVVLLDVTPGSPHRGETVPLTFEYTAAETNWQPENLLAVAPVWGFPLHGATQYALLFRPPLVAPPRAGLWADLDHADTRETLEGLGIDPEDISYAVLFTTQDPLKETARIARTIHEDLARPALDQALTFVDERGTYTLYSGTVLLPVWQQGERPYHTTGGGFRFTEDGTPVLDRWERVAFALSIPHGEPPAHGWPVVLYAHGTGGDQQTFCYSGATEEEATVLGREGVAMIGVSQPLHGDRGTPDTSVYIDSFNFYNPDAGRSTFRQGALDQVYLAGLLAGSPPHFTIDGQDILLDPDNVGYMGHSEGGLVGALAGPFFSTEVKASVLSGAGGGLSLTVLLRKDPLDISGAIAALFEFGEEEEITTFHPLIGLVQTLVEASDPLNYAPHWYAEPVDWDARPLPVMMTEGMLDIYTPSLTAEALAAAARLPIVGDAASDPEALRLRNIEGSPLPTAENAKGWDGASLTAGIGQFPEDGHYAIYDNPAARRLYRNFLTSALVEDAPVLDED